MALSKEGYSNELRDFIKAQQQTVQTNSDKAIEMYAAKMEELIDKRIKSVTITIPAGSIIISGPGGGGTNVNPIVLQGLDVFS